jgi:hypothetical protein
LIEVARHPVETGEQLRSGGSTHGLVQKGARP